MTERTPFITKEERLYLANDPRTPSDLLGKLLLEDPYEEVRLAAAKNPNTSPQDLIKFLNQHPESDLTAYQIIKTVFDNPNTPESIKERCKIALLTRNFPVPEEVLKALAFDTDSKEKERTLNSIPYAESVELKLLANSTEDPDILKSIMKAVNTPFMTRISVAKKLLKNIVKTK